VDFLDFRFVLLDDDRITVDDLDHLAGELAILGQNFRAGTLEVFPQTEALLLGRSLSLAVLFGSRRDAGQGPVYNLGQTFLQQSLGDVAHRVDYGSDLSDKAFKIFPIKCS